MPLVSVPWLEESTTRVFQAVGLSPSAASSIAEALVRADQRGTSSHGTLLVPLYVERVLHGSVSVRETAEIVSDFGAVATLDARNAFGILTGDQAMGLAVEKALKFGIGAVAVRHAFHFGAASRYSCYAADRGLIGLATANTRVLMPAPGAAQAVVGNNPLSIAAPMANGNPVVLDMALSQAALGKIRLAEQEGKTIPSTWATDDQGNPTTDPHAAIRGLLLPAAGPKGYGLAVMLDVLTGILSGGAFGASVHGLYKDTAIPNDCAHFFLAINPQAFGLDDFPERLAALGAEILRARKAPGTSRLLLPGQLELERSRSAEGEGIAMDPSILEKFREVAGMLGVELAVMV